MILPKVSSGKKTLLFAGRNDFTFHSWEYAAWLELPASMMQGCKYVMTKDKGQV
jgi:hypothetical protein